jgi:hypothetical protein
VGIVCKIWIFFPIGHYTIILSSGCYYLMFANFLVVISTGGKHTHTLCWCWWKRWWQWPTYKIGKF